MDFSVHTRNQVFTVCMCLCAYKKKLKFIYEVTFTHSHKAVYTIYILKKEKKNRKKIDALNIIFFQSNIVQHHVVPQLKETQFPKEVHLRTPSLRLVDYMLKNSRMHR